MIRMVSALPTGSKGDWAQAPYHTMAHRFEHSACLPLFTSQRQCTAKYSQGMMASPALGAKLFRLRRFESETWLPSTSKHDHTVVVGSSIGGTGASVGPTLARHVAKDGHQATALMLLRWFSLTGDGPEVVARNEDIRANEASALHYYKQSLAQTVTVVPLGVPEPQMAQRSFAGDSNQPEHPHYLHAVAAIAAEKQLQKDHAVGPGMYGMATQDAAELSSDTQLSRGTLGHLARAGETFLHCLHCWVKVLNARQSRKVRPAIYDALFPAKGESTIKPREVAAILQQLAGLYETELRWLQGLIGELPRFEDFTLEARSRARLAEDNSRAKIPTRSSAAGLARALYEWTGAWIADARPPQGDDRTTATTSYYLPKPRHTDVGRPKAGQKRPGELEKIAGNSLDTFIDSIVAKEHVTENGWPDPMSAASFYKWALEQEQIRAQRQFILMVLGAATGVLRVARLDLTDTNEPLSLEKLLHNERDDFPGLGEYLLWLDHDGNSTLVGFTAPHTLVCPVPHDQRMNHVWQELHDRLMEQKSVLWTTAELSPKMQATGRALLDWFKGLIGRHNRQQAPKWLSIFARHVRFRDDRGLAQTHPAEGCPVQVLWGTQGESPEVVPIFLPCPKAPGFSSVQLKPLTLSEFKREVPSLVKCVDNTGWVYEWIDKADIPNVDSHAIWQGHLSRLVQQGVLEAVSAQDGLHSVVARIRGDLCICTLEDTIVLREEDVFVQHTLLLEQEADGDARRDTFERMLTPDFPVRSRWASLIVDEHGRGLEDRDFACTAAARQYQGLDTVYEWQGIYLRGARAPFKVTRPVFNEQSTKAHWMVWPRFRSAPATPHPWRAYYLYQKCRLPRVRVGALSYEVSRGLCVQDADPGGPMMPLGFRHGDFCGTAPLALAAKHIVPGGQAEEDLGLFLTRLEILGQIREKVAIAVDFGSANTIAALRYQGREEVVSLRSESKQARISKRISYDKADAESLIGQGTYLPTYALEDRVTLPTEILLASKRDRMIANSQVKDWQPGRDFTIPSGSVTRDELAAYLIADFKWRSEVGSSNAELREHYLAMFLQMVLAQVITDRLRGFPADGLDIVFTYPLRNTQSELNSLRSTIANLRMRVMDTMGVSAPVEVRTVDESRSARIRTNSYGQVNLVADLGGGTLDMMISAVAPGTANNGEMPQLVDSVKLGGNLLLEQLASDPERFLPGDWPTDSAEAYALLRGWMRSQGAAKLFGDAPETKHRDYGAFRSRTEASEARQLISRYFHTVDDYLARSLVAYLHDVWVTGRQRPDDVVEIVLQLSGSGWRIDPESGGGGNRSVLKDRLDYRVRELWREYGQAPLGWRWVTPDIHEHPEPKVATIIQALRMTGKEEDVTEKRYPLFDLNINHGERFDWNRPLPIHAVTGSRIVLRTSGSGAQLGLAPPLRIPAGGGRLLDVTLLMREVMQLNTDITQHARDGYGDSQVPVGTWVFERIFESQAYYGARPAPSSAKPPTGSSSPTEHNAQNGVRRLPE